MSGGGKHADEYRQMLVMKAYTKPTTGNESLHSETNNNSIKIIQFPISNGLNVRSTMFPHKDIKKKTWYSAGNRTTSQTDHVLISNRLRTAITDITQLKDQTLDQITTY